MSRNKQLIQKSGTVENQELTDEELEKINKFALKSLSKEDIYTFKLRICDNEIDRDFEVFPLETLETLKDLFIGKTIIKDHASKADNQVARIYDTELVTESGRTKLAEPYTSLIAHCYMVKTESNRDLITEIEAGIKKEVSVGCAISEVICSICGVDNRKCWCEHWHGQEYDGEICYFKLQNPIDAYEVSFVAVPAQPKAGTTKNYGPKAKKGNSNIVDSKTTRTNENTQEKNNNLNEEDLISLKMKTIKSFIFAQKNLDKKEGM
ncbi:MAG: hypothetical protein V8R01_01770 [Bacilli bacterium]